MAQYHISEAGLHLIRTFEGCRLHQYLCPAGKPTIGYGHVIHPDDGIASPITIAQAEELLLEDLRPVAHYVGALKNITQSRFDALCSFAYNVGIGALDKSTLRRKLRDGLVAGAADELLRWCYYTGPHGDRLFSTGLQRRRLAERELFLKDGVK
jgi:lysozyme